MFLVLPASSLFIPSHQWVLEQVLKIRRNLTKPPLLPVDLDRVLRSGRLPVSPVLLQVTPMFCDSRALSKPLSPA